MLRFDVPFPAPSLAAARAAASAAATSPASSMASDSSSRTALASSCRPALDQVGDQLIGPAASCSARRRAGVRSVDRTMLSALASITLAASTPRS